MHDETDLKRAVRRAYGAAAPGWADGPHRLYRRLAGVLVERGHDTLAGRVVLDAGAGTGAVAEALHAAGARPVRLDACRAMLVAGGPGPAVTGDVTRLPLAAGSVAAAVTAFCLNHLADPVAGLAELGRVTVAGGLVLAATFADQERHPAPAMVDQVAERHGFRPPGWHDELKRAEAALAPAGALAAAARSAGLAVVADEVVAVDGALTDPAAMVVHRLGLAPLAGFVAGLPPDRRAALTGAATAALAGVAPLHLRLAVVAATAPA